MSMCSVYDVATASATGVYRREREGERKECASKRDRVAEREEKQRLSNELRWV